LVMFYCPERDQFAPVTGITVKFSIVNIVLTKALQLRQKPNAHALMLVVFTTCGF